MFRVIVGSILGLAIAGPALAAAEIETCRDAGVIRINPNYVRAYVGRGQLFEKRRDPGAARSDYRAASAALAKVEDIETTLARRFARERLEALQAGSNKPAAGETATAPPILGRVIVNGGPKKLL